MTPRAPRSVRLGVETLEGREVPAILFGVTAANQLVTFDSANPSAVLRITPIGGQLSPGEVITDIDVRPGTGGIYGRSNLGQLFLISPFNAFAIPIGNPVPTAAGQLGFDFDPRNDRIRIFTHQRENLVIDSVTGSLLQTGSPLTYVGGTQGVPRITGLAFGNNVPFARTTQVFAIDHLRNTLVAPAGPTVNNGLLRSIGSLGVDVGPLVGFDIAPVSGAMFASFQVNGEGLSRLYVVNRATGRASQIGAIGGGLLLRDIAVDTRGTSGFTSASGFFALPPPTTNPPVFSTTPGASFNVPGATGNPPVTSPLFPPLTQPLPPTLTSPLPGSLTSPFFPGTVGP